MSSWTSLEQELRALLPDLRVSAGESDLRQHGTDFSLHPPSPPDVVVYAERTGDVAATLAFASARGIPVVPFGVGTSLEGHVIPVRGGISLDLSRMNRILDLRPEDLAVTVEAGVTRMQLTTRAAEHGLFFPVDPGADATLGGMAATRASGTTTVRYGTMQRQVIALEVVLADGTVIRTGTRAVKSAAGYDLTALFVGSEGTLGVITELTLRLYGIPEAVVAVRAVFRDLESACRTAVELIAAAVPVSRLELLDAWTIRCVNRYKQLSLQEAPTLLVEIAGGVGAVAGEVETLREFASDNGCETIEVEDDPTQRSRLWQARHDAAYAVMATAPGKRAKSTDICVPLSQLPAAVQHARRVVDRLGFEAGIAGHVGDGNYHVAFMVDPNDAGEVAQAKELDEELVGDALARGGTCTGEHGIGLGKIEFLRRQHPDLLPLMRGLKELLDPDGILNPGKLLPE